MNVIEFEQRVFEIEEVRLVIRAPSTAEVEDFDFQRSAATGTSITEWIRQRIEPRIGDYTVVVVDGSGSIPHGRTRMSRLRESYED